MEEVPRDGESSSDDRQEQDGEVFSEKNYREEAGNGGDRGHPSDESRAQRMPQRGKQAVQTPEWAKTLIENQQRMIKYSTAQIDLLRSEVRALKRKRDESDSDFKWKMKGNKKQYEFSRSVESQLEDVAAAKTALDAGNSTEGLFSERTKQTY